MIRYSETSSKAATNTPRKMPGVVVLLWLLATFLTPLTAQSPSGSYIKLRGSRLAKFEKTKAASEARLNIQLSLPAKILNDGSVGKLGKSKKWVCFEHKKVLYYLPRKDPYLIQSRRKAAKKKGNALMLIKGRVRRLRRDGKKIWAVRVMTIQVKGTLKSKGRKKKRPAASKTEPLWPKHSPGAKDDEPIKKKRVRRHALTEHSQFRCKSCAGG